MQVCYTIKLCKKDCENEFLGYSKDDDHGYCYCRNIYPNQSSLKENAVPEVEAASAVARSTGAASTSSTTAS